MFDGRGRHPHSGTDRVAFPGIALIACEPRRIIIRPKAGSIAPQTATDLQTADARPQRYRSDAPTI
jgi:hypothetical protein